MAKMIKKSDEIRLRCNIVSIYLITIYLSVIMMSGCGNAERSIRSNFTVSAIDPSFFNEYILIFLESENGKEYRVLSPRLGQSDTLILNSCYRHLTVGSKYNFTITKYEAPPRATSNADFHGMSYQYFTDDDVLFWANDSIYQDVYYSENLQGEYLKP